MMANIGNLPIVAILAAIAIGAIWKPGLAVSTLGLLVFLIGTLPLAGLVRVPGGYAMAVVGMGAFPTAITGIFVMAFGRLVSSVEGILRRLGAAPAAQVAEGDAVSRREPTFRRESRFEF
ncbi:hypothetical protein [Aureimonas leprariae]|uniref:Uncharacterized protein n=1 Tax=Plantimonas leprariae TaxID=2615207 RepID=A0A7V7PMH8_9HYPH|nr:hypothetical protein [Aureimonas leprariae]KAB0678111.1 hypothetical protein F6X38_16960 [Aureimonas leprariae]